ncbi:MAG: DUF2147 domain-containing protein [Bacteroidales bacterium]
MRKLAILFCFMFFSFTGIFAQSGGIVGYWLTEEGESQIEIYRVPGNKFNGRIVWLEEPFEDDGSIKRDDENPDRSLRNRPTLGIELLKDFTYNASKQEWENGTIYDPESGKTYDAFMRLEGNNTMKLKGFVLGMRFLGRESTWTRDEELRE